MGRLIATKEFSYNTRMLRAGDTFDAASDKDARLLVGIGKAKTSREPGRIDAPNGKAKAKMEEIVEDAEIEALRSAADGAGVKYDKRWGSKRLQAEIESAVPAEPVTAPIAIEPPTAATEASADGLQV
jgi:hypothetical protein